MELGAFSVSLNVKDIHASKAFYEKLGFTVFHGDITQNWLILKNGNATLGLFQGMFEKNILTFNPGWDQSAQPLESFDDIRKIGQSLKSDGVNLISENTEGSSGPGNITLTDPDGNPVLIDQHL